jgi:hypothetical protein
MEVEVASLRCLGVNQQAAASDLSLYSIGTQPTAH